MANRMTMWIMICLVLGILAGAILHSTLGVDEQKLVAGYFKIVTDVFLRMIKMIIAPLVFSTLVSGVVHMGDTKTLGRIGLRTMIWFIGATIVSLTSECCWSIYFSLASTLGWSFQKPSWLMPTRK